jgi:hypothetical protein
LIDLAAQARAELLPGNRTVDHGVGPEHNPVAGHGVDGAVIDQPLGQPVDLSAQLAPARAGRWLPTRSATGNRRDAPGNE